MKLDDETRALLDYLRREIDVDLAGEALVRLIDHRIELARAESLTEPEVTPSVIPWPQQAQRTVQTFLREVRGSSVGSVESTDRDLARILIDRRSDYNRLYIIDLHRDGTYTATSGYAGAWAKILAADGWTRS